MPQKVTPPLVQSTILRDVGGIVEKIEVPGGASPYEQALVDSPVPIQVRYPSQLFDDNQFQPLLHDDACVAGESIIIPSDEETNTYILDEVEDVIQGCVTILDTSFHSLSSESFTVKRIEAMGVDPLDQVAIFSRLSSAKRRKSSYEGEGHSSALKRNRS